MANNNKYANICYELLGTPCPDEKFYLIKDHFRKHIDSVRRFDRITNLQQLIKILEDRDVLSREDVTSLRFPANALKRNDIIELINGYDFSSEEPLPPPIILYPRSRVTVLPEVDPDPINRIYDTICLGIGQKWKIFARKLKIPEGFIDEIEHRYPLSITEGVRKILVCHRNTCDERYWRVELCQALVDARRRDLSDNVQTLFSRYSLS